MTMCPGQDIHFFWIGYQSDPQIKDMHCCQEGLLSESKYSSVLHWISIPTVQDHKIHKKNLILKTRIHS